MKALDDAQQTDKPFFLYMAHYAIIPLYNLTCVSTRSTWTKAFLR